MQDDGNKTNKKYNLRKRKRIFPDDNEIKKRTKKRIKKRTKKRTKKKRNFIDGYEDDGFIVEDTVMSEEFDGSGKIVYDESEDFSDEDVFGGSVSFNENEENYFEYDTKPIQEDIIKRLKSQTNLPAEKITEIVEEVFAKTSDILTEKYVGCKPISSRWKLGIDDSEVKQLEPLLNKIRDDIENDQPTIPKILKANITTEEKKRCIILYDQLNNIEPYTDEHARMSIKISNIIKAGNKYKKEDILKLEKTEKELKENIGLSDDIKNRILELKAPIKIKRILYEQYLEMMQHEPESSSYNSIREEIEWSLRLPYNSESVWKDFNNITNSERNMKYKYIMDNMNKELYGMKNIKLKMLHIINDLRIYNLQDRKTISRNLAIVGPPGTGKTCIGKTFAKVLNVPFDKISLGGMEDASILKGSDKVWQSAAPSIVLQILARMKSSSGVVMFDEVDKLGATSKGKMVQYALLHISDYVHNKSFRDNYLNKYTHDFSKILFIFNMNSREGLDSALLSRLDIIETHPYSDEEKRHIIRNYVLPKSLRSVGLNCSDIVLSEESTDYLIDLTKKDPGVRMIEQFISSLVGKINMYFSIRLDDGTMGELDLGYNISDFKLPYVVEKENMVGLIG